MGTAVNETAVKIFNILSTNVKGNFTQRIKYIHVPRLNLLGEWILNKQHTGRVSSRPISKVEDCVN